MPEDTAVVIFHADEPRSIARQGNITEDILQNLQERVKELTALHTTARILQDSTRSAEDVMKDIVGLLPRAWQYPGAASARIEFGTRVVTTPGFVETVWRQSATFVTRSGVRGCIEICYGEAQPEADEGPFLKEERELIGSLAEMLRSYFEHLLADEALRQAHDDLERLVRVRTEELQQSNAALEAQVTEYREAELRIAKYQTQLRQLASELSLAEARERRSIASDLHDHIGQALAFIKMNVSQFRGNAIFCGFEDKIEQIMSLLNQTIQYTRNLTFQISPPILYELGLQAALEWLAEHLQKTRHLPVMVTVTGEIGRCGDDVQVTLFKSVQELLTNSMKHAGASRVQIRISRRGDQIIIDVDDDGCGFDTAILKTDATYHERYGLFNIQERLDYLGGQMTIESRPGGGTKVTLEAPCQAKGSDNEDQNPHR